MRKLFFLVIGMLSSHLLSAQDSYSSADFASLQAFEEFQSRKYQSVIISLQNEASLTSSEEILLLLSELKTGLHNASTVEDWYSRNQKHPIGPLVSYHLGEHFFYTADTAKSKAYLTAISPSTLSTPDKAGYGFLFGIIQLSENEYRNAKNLFQYARRFGYDNKTSLDYYEAYADYHLNDRAAAMIGFEKSVNSTEYGSSSRFFMAKIQLENGELDHVISLAQGELSDDKTETNSGFHQIIGEAYALKQNTEKADAYFERAIDVHPGRPSAALYYQAGVAKFRIGNEDQAISYFKEAGIQGGEYAQLSAFQLGRLYLKKKDYENALFAYVEASASTDLAIREEAFFQSAKIHAERGNYSEALQYAKDYLDEFEDGQWKTEIQNLIAQSYLRTSNYDLAIEHLKSIGVTTSTQEEVYQVVTFQKASMLFNDGSFLEAKEWFEESLKYAPDILLKNQAFYFLGEIDLRAGKYSQAAENYRKQTLIDPLSHYGLGYAFYNQRKYNEAIDHFRNALNASESEIQLDAEVRLADCLYAVKSFKEANTIYSRLSDKTDAPYVQYQLGNTLKNLSRADEAIGVYQNLFTSTRYGAAARFESGLIYFEQAEFKEAIAYFDQVIDEFPNSVYYGEALLNRAVARKNQGDLDSAKDDFLVILKRFPGDEISLNAILGLQELQQSGVSVNDLDSYINAYKKANPNSSSLEVIEFEAAKRLYFDFAYENATASFQQFLKDYPNSSSKMEAKYLLADSYYRLDKFSDAEPILEELKYVRNTYTGRILSRLGETNKRLQDVSGAEQAYLLLLDLDLSPKDTYNAQYGLMNLYFETSQFKKAVAQANSVLKGAWKALNAEQEATMIQAKSELALGNIGAAKAYFESLSKGSDSYAAEANYSLALILFTESAHEKSLDVLFDLNANYASYQAWIDQSYLLIARNYIALEELFQAKATLRSIIQHSNNDEVNADARKYLNQIEQNTIVTDSIDR